VIAAGTALIAILDPSLYRDNSFVRSGWYGNDLVTLFVAVPLSMAALRGARRNSTRWRLVWLGTVAFALYNYAFYLFGAAFNRLFILYAAIVALAILALIRGITETHIHERIASRATSTVVGAYMLFVAVGLAIVEGLQVLDFVITGSIPPVIQAVGHPTNVVFALDFTLVIPFMTWGAVSLRQRNALVAVVVLIAGAIYMAALTAASIAALQAGLTNVRGQIPIWILLLGGHTTAAVMLLGSRVTPDTR
jgi:hypothetical protein